MHGKFALFWSTIRFCDWDYEGDDEKVLKPVIEYLSRQPNEIIFRFHDLMNELLYNLDTKKLADQCEEETGFCSGDSFLYSRCVAIINDIPFYEKVKSGKYKDIWNMEFESVLYVPSKAWALKNSRSVDDYPYIPPLSCETGSNKEAWK